MADWSLWPPGAPPSSGPAPIKVDLPDGPRVRRRPVPAALQAARVIAGLQGGLALCGTAALGIAALVLAAHLGDLMPVLAVLLVVPIIVALPLPLVVVAILLHPDDPTLRTVLAVFEVVILGIAVALSAAGVTLAALPLLVSAGAVLACLALPSARRAFASDGARALTPDRQDLPDRWEEPAPSAGAPRRPATERSVDALIGQDGVTWDDMKAYWKRWLAGRRSGR